MDSDSNSGFNSEYLHHMYQNLLKTGNNISLAELNTGTDSGNQATNQLQIKQTLAVIQSNGAKVDSVSTTPHETSHNKAGPSGISLLKSLPSKDGRIMGYRKRQLGGNNVQRSGSGKDPYYQKWKYLKKYVKNMVFMNAAICDEVVRQEEKVARVREERRFLLHKLLQYQSLTDTPALAVKHMSPIMLKSPSVDQLTGVKIKPKKKVPIGDKAKQTREMLESLGMKAKPKKSKVGGGKHIVPPIPLDSIGRPIFPLVIGDLTLHSVGEIVPDRPGFHTSNSIFPVGFCSTRVYSSLIDPEKPCLYTCKIMDGGNGPMFELVPDNDSRLFRSRFLSECHSQLLRALNQTRGTKLVDTTGKGPEFFGLSHPVVQNLIQSCPGAKKCNGYKWVKFEVNKNITIQSMLMMSEDPTISHHALKMRLSALQVWKTHFHKYMWLEKASNASELYQKFLGAQDEFIAKNLSDCFQQRLLRVLSQQSSSGFEQSPSNLRTLLTGAVLDTNKLAT